VGRLGVIIFLSATLLSAQDVESLHQFNAFLKPTPKLTLQTHLRVRSNDHISNLFQFRGGPLAHYAVKPRLTLIAGYYYIGQEVRFRGDIDDFHRGFGGFQVPLIKNSKMVLESRTLVERFVFTPSGNFTRGRQRLYWQSQGRTIMPYFSVEGLYAQQRGTVRVGMGVVRQLSPTLQMGMGYETRQYANGAVGHLVTSNIQFTQKREK
jgi:hypothetical protein